MFIDYILSKLTQSILGPTQTNIYICVQHVLKYFYYTYLFTVLFRGLILISLCLRKLFINRYEGNHTVDTHKTESKVIRQMTTINRLSKICIMFDKPTVLHHTFTHILVTTY